MKIVLKRVYRQAAPADGYRVLVDRLWPRGVSKEEAGLSEWNKDLAPTTELRVWFGHDPAKWDEFSKRYMQELLDKNPGKDFLERNANQYLITLVYAAKDEQHAHPLILKDYLDKLYKKLV